MIATFKYAVRKFRGSILGWGLTMGLLSWFIVVFYKTVAENAEQFTTLFSSYPKELAAFFNMSNMMAFATPQGYLSIEFFSYMPLIIGIFALLAGSGLLAGDEERGILDLIAAHPVSRSSLFWGRLAAFVLTIAVILAAGYAGIVLSKGSSALDISAGEVLVAFVSLFGLLLFFGGLSLMLSMLLPSRQTAAMISGVVLVASFIFNGLAQINDKLSGLEPFLPIHYVQNQNWEKGLDISSFALLAGLGIAFCLAAWVLFLRRDIRVGGEGGWSLPKLLLRRQAAIKA